MLKDVDDIQAMLAAEEAERALRSRLIQVGLCLDFVALRAKSLSEALGIPAMDAARIVMSLLLGES